MKIKVNQKLLPVKAHYFFFMAAMGPILPFLNVFGKQLGISEFAMGSVNSVLPILFLITKPLFGFVADYFRKQRKLIFMGVVFSMTFFYVLLYFVPDDGLKEVFSLENIEMNSIAYCGSQNGFNSTDEKHKEASCHINCDNQNGYQLNSVLYVNDNKSEIICMEMNTDSSFNELCNITCLPITDTNFYFSPSFWSFVILMSLGTIAFNISNSVSDAICFDVLGAENEMKYGQQRVWGTIGFGIAALIGGYAIDLWSIGNVKKDYTPVFIIISVLTFIDLYWCSLLKLPEMNRSERILKDIGQLLKHKHIIVFLIFATLAGILDAYIIYFLFWYLEDLAHLTNDMGHIKLLEGLVIAAETLCGEVIIFPLSGKFLKKFGYGHCMSFCFICYAVRLGLISLIKSPWMVLPIELFMQGPTYAMCYATIVSYASAVAPHGASATMQGLVAGMDDGFGYAIGGLIGGILYKRYGGSTTFKILSTTALISGITHFLLYVFWISKQAMPVADKPANNVQYKDPEAASKITQNHTSK